MVVVVEWSGEDELRWGLAQTSTSKGSCSCVYLCVPSCLSVCLSPRLLVSVLCCPSLPSRRVVLCCGTYWIRVRHHKRFLMTYSPHTHWTGSMKYWCNLSSEKKEAEQEFGPSMAARTPFVSRGRAAPEKPSWKHSGTLCEAGWNARWRGSSLRTSFLQLNPRCTSKPPLRDRCRRIFESGSHPRRVKDTDVLNQLGMHPSQLTTNVPVREEVRRTAPLPET